MINSIKQKISNFLARRRYLNKNTDKIKFNDFLKTANSFLLLMPNEEKDFNLSLKLMDYLLKLDKNLALLVPVQFVSKVSSGKRTQIIQYSYEDVNKFNLPTDFLKNKLNRKSFDIVIDLERFENLLYSSLTNLTKSKFKIGFQKEKLNEFYNILIVQKNERPEYCYDDLINSLKMF